MVKNLERYQTQLTEAIEVEGGSRVVLENGGQKERGMAFILLACLLDFMSTA